MARNGRRDEAREVVREMDKRLEKLKPQFRKEGRAWRDVAAQALHGA
jgi:pentatricopeptide repeat protein